MVPNIANILQYDSESNKLDFKQAQYSLGPDFNRNEILKDISAFANHHSNEEKLIIIGIKEKHGSFDSIVNITNPIDEAKYQNFLLEYIEPKINFEYRTIQYQGNLIAYFKIYDNLNRPYLFRKDIINPVTKNIEYKKGDGFIRTGTSTKKIDRTDLDIIYKTKYTSADRKNDLSFKTCVSDSKDETLVHVDVKYLDIEIFNSSNKSIDFDIQMKVFKGEGYALLSERDLKEELRRKAGPKRTSIYEVRVEAIAPINMFVDFSEESDYVIISRNKRTNKAAINLPQNSSEKDIFDQSVYVIGTVKHIRAEITIRSDDFTEGALVQAVAFEL